MPATGPAWARRPPSGPGPGRRGTTQPPASSTCWRAWRGSAAGTVEEPHGLLDEVGALPALGRAHELVVVVAAGRARPLHARELHRVEEHGPDVGAVAVEVDLDVGDVVRRPWDRGEGLGERRGDLVARTAREARLAVVDDGVRGEHRLPEVPVPGVHAPGVAGQLLLDLQPVGDRLRLHAG